MDFPSNLSSLNARTSFRHLCLCDACVISTQRGFEFALCSRRLRLLGRFRGARGAHHVLGGRHGGGQLH